MEKQNRGEKAEQNKCESDVKYMFLIFFDATVFIVLSVLCMLCGLAGLTSLIELIVKLRFVILFLLFIVGLIVAKKTKFLFCKIIIVIQTLLICYTVDNMCLNFYAAVDMEFVSAICIALIGFALISNVICILELCDCKKVDASVVIRSVVGTIISLFLAGLTCSGFSVGVILACAFYLPIIFFVAGFVYDF